MIAVELHELHRRLPAGVLHQSHGVGGEPGLVQAFPQDGGDGHVGGDGRRRTPQKHGVARLEAETGGVTGHVGPVLVDDPDDPQWGPHPLHPQAVGADPPLHHLAHRVGQSGHLAQAVGHALQPSVHPQPVEGGGVGTGLLGPPDVGGVGLEDPVGVHTQQVGGALQGLVPGRRGRPGQHPAGGNRSARQVDHRRRRGRCHRVSVLPGLRTPTRRAPPPTAVPRRMLRRTGPTRLRSPGTPDRTGRPDRRVASDTHDKLLRQGSSEAVPSDTHDKLLRQGSSEAVPSECLFRPTAQIIGSGRYLLSQAIASSR